MKQNKNWIIVFSGYYSPSYVYGIGNLVFEFHKDEYCILWINSIPNRNPSQTRAGSKKTLFKNLLKKFRQHLRPIKKVKRNFFVYNPLYFPFPENKKVYALNVFILRNQIRLLRFFLNIKDRFIILSSSMTDVPSLFPTKVYLKYIHYIADLYSDYRDAATIVKDRIKDLERKCFNEADLLLVSSFLVVEKVKKIVVNSKKIVYFPHGVDFKHFNSAISSTASIPALAEIDKPIAGYFGSLTMANDQEAILSLRDAGFYVVLIGDIKGEYDKLKNTTCIQFLGQIPYSELPSYAACFDIAFMAWKPSEWIRNSNPKKTYEYLALGLPIISVRINQLEKELAEYVYFADKPSDFGPLAKIALEENSKAKIDARIRVAETADWKTKYLNIKSKLIEKV